MLSFSADLRLTAVCWSHCSQCVGGSVCFGYHHLWLAYMKQCELFVSLISPTVSTCLQMSGMVASFPHCWKGDGNPSSPGWMKTDTAWKASPPAWSIPQCIKRLALNRQCWPFYALILSSLQRNMPLPLSLLFFFLIFVVSSSLSSFLRVRWGGEHYCLLQIQPLWVRHRNFRQSFSFL